MTPRERFEAKLPREEKTGKAISVYFTPEEHEAAWDGWQAAIAEVIAEWEKPYGLTDGRTFIERLRDMANVGINRTEP